MLFDIRGLKLPLPNSMDFRNPNAFEFTVRTATSPKKK